MKHFLILPAIAGAFLLASCELEEQIEPAEEAYTKAFIKEFGVIDPKQDWNMATRGSVTVNTPSATEVKVYGLVDGEYRLVGDFGGVSGSKTLEFDMPRGTENLLVSSCGMGKATSVGGTADFSGTRVALTWKGTEENSHGVEVTKLTDYKEFTVNKASDGTGVFEYRTTLPEGKFNGGKVTQSFHFISDGKPFVIYPVYWHTGAVPEYGIAFMESGNTTPTLVPVYNIKSGDEMQYKMPERKTAGTVNISSYYSVNNTTKSKPYDSWPIKAKIDDLTEEDQKAIFEWMKSNNNDIKDWSNLSYKVGKENTWDQSNSFIVTGTLNGETKSKAYNFYALSNMSGIPLTTNLNGFTEEELQTFLNYLRKNNYKDETGTDWKITVDANGYGYTATIDRDVSAWKDVSGFSNQSSGQGSASADENYDTYEYRSLGIQIKVPEGTDFAFYCKNGNYVMYSRQDWNTDNYRYAKEGSETADSEDTSKRGLHGATFINNEGTRCIAMEDWFGSGNDVDLNDGVFYTTLATGDDGSKIVDEDAQSYIIAAEDLGSIDDFDFNDMVIKVTTPTLKSGTEDTYELKVKVLAAGGTLPLKICRDNEALVDNSNNDEIHAMFGVSTGTMVNTDNGTVSKDYIDLKTIELTAEQKEAFTITSQSVDETNKKQLTKMGGFSFIVDRGNDGTFTTTTEITAPDSGTAPQMMCLPDKWKWPKERVRISTAYPKFDTWGENYSNTDWLGTVNNDSVVTK